MAADPTLAPKSRLADDQQAFENEIPTYRALSPLAIASAGLGLLAGLSFVSPMWRVAAVLAIVAGIFADFRIRKMPDLFTGRSYAHAGIAMGLMFGISSIAYNYWAEFSLMRDSRAFAEEFTQTLNKAKKTTPPDTADAMWFMLHPDMRKGITPEEARIKIAEVSEGSAKVQQIEVQIRQMAKFAGIEKPIEVLTIEDAFFQDRDGYATVLLKIGDGTNHFHDAHKNHNADSKPKINQSKNQRKNEIRVEEEIIGQGPENALLVLHGVIVGRDYRFFVDQIRYPYVPKEFKYIPVKAKDDGHGHDH